MSAVFFCLQRDSGQFWLTCSWLVGGRFRQIFTFHKRLLGGSVELDVGRRSVSTGLSHDVTTLCSVSWCSAISLHIRVNKALPLSRQPMFFAANMGIGNRHFIVVKGISQQERTARFPAVRANTAALGICSSYDFLPQRHLGGRVRSVDTFNIATSLTVQHTPRNLTSDVGHSRLSYT